MLILAGVLALSPLGVILPGSCFIAWIVSLIVFELTSGITGNKIENCLKTGIVEDSEGGVGERIDCAVMNFLSCRRKSIAPKSSVMDEMET